MIYTLVIVILMTNGNVVKTNFYYPNKYTCREAAEYMEQHEVRNKIIDNHKNALRLMATCIPEIKIIG